MEIERFLRSPVALQLMNQNNSLQSAQLIQERVSADVNKLSGELKQIINYLNLVIDALTFASQHSDNPYCQELISSTRDKTNAVKGAVFGQFADCLLWIKYLSKQKQAHIKSASRQERRADIWVSGDDSYPGKAIQLKATSGKTPGDVKPHLKKALLQVSGATGENPRHLRRIVEVILFDEGVSWPMTNLTKIPDLPAMCERAIDAINDAYVSQIKETIGAGLGAIMNALGGGDTGAKLAPANPMVKNPLKQTLAGQFTKTPQANQLGNQQGNQSPEFKKEFDVVVTKIVVPGGVCAKDTQGLLNIFDKLIFITWVEGKQNPSGIGFQCNLRTRMVELKNTEQKLRVSCTYEKASASFQI
jgi:hypothetical protein